MIVGETWRASTKLKPRIGADTIASATVTCSPSGGLTFGAVTITADGSTTAVFNITAVTHGTHIATVTANLTSGLVGIGQFTVQVEAV
jgi:hypothetical protein